MHELQHEDLEPTLVLPAGVVSPRLRLLEAPTGAKVRLANGRLVVATGIVIQGARFVRPVLVYASNDLDARSSRGELRLGSMEVQAGDQFVTVA